jgi:hypothetical protein
VSLIAKLMPANGGKPRNRVKWIPPRQWLDDRKSLI